jgi:hypothetical protein
MAAQLFARELQQTVCGLYKLLRRIEVARSLFLVYTCYDFIYFLIFLLITVSNLSRSGNSTSHVAHISDFDVNRSEIIYR